MRKLASIALIVLISSSLLINSGLYTINPNKVGTDAVSPVLILFGHSNAELSAEKLLLHNFPNAKSIPYSLFNSGYQSIKSNQPIIYLGHGSDQGIAFDGQIIPWANLIGQVKAFSSNPQYILSCESQEAGKIAQNIGLKIFTFPMVVDALVGAQFITFDIFNNLNMIKQAESSFKGLFARVHELYSSPSSFLPLYVIDHLGWVETTVVGFNALMIAFLIFLTASGASLQNEADNAFVSFIKTAPGLALMRALINLGLGIITGNAGLLTTAAWSFVNPLLAFANYIIQTALSWWLIAKALASLGIDAATLASGVGIALKVAALLVLGYSAYNTYLAFIADKNDYNDVPYG